MRTYGRLPDGTWVQVSTDASGDSSNVWLTTLAQTIRLNLNESPFFGQYGIPAHQSVATQIAPDFYVAQTQTQFSPYFASLAIQRVPNVFPPAYRAKAVCFNGAVLDPVIAT